MCLWAHFCQLLVACTLYLSHHVKLDITRAQFNLLKPNNVHKGRFKLLRVLNPFTVVRCKQYQCYKFDMLCYVIVDISFMADLHLFNLFENKVRELYGCTIDEC